MHGEKEKATPRHVKKRKAHTAAFFAEDSDGQSEAEVEPVVEDELTKYLNLPQIKYTTEWDAGEWWKAHHTPP